MLIWHVKGPQIVTLCYNLELNKIFIFQKMNLGVEEEIEKEEKEPLLQRKLKISKEQMK